MNIDYYDYLCCPNCNGSLNLTVNKKNKIGIQEGSLSCNNCSNTYPIIDYIPRFVDFDNYSSNFGFEWNLLGYLKSDSYTKKDFTKNTILIRTGWAEEFFKDKLILVCGCGPGNDSEALLKMGAKVIAFDYSNSVKLAFNKNGKNPNFLVVQANIFKIPLKLNLFDIVFCHRVIQHTPNPELAFYSMVKHIKIGGNIFLHSYGLTPRSRINYHYILRFITKRINYYLTYKVLEKTGPFLYELVGMLKNQKNRLYSIILRFIPFENFKTVLAGSNLTEREKYLLTLLNVFDRLTPKYDNPNTVMEILNWFKKKDLKGIQIRGINPVLIVAKK
ncbi:MAG: methyltransferase domain-containing protein [Candidatus Thorarchaeota archaeon]